ncbi:pilus assembly protein [Sphingomonas sp. IC-11]|uniref:TadE/TadG family type IV pilus assembly protein n=1 Tax=Sphingomonas sp. IC-11 TaxID=2898528 RepID=UPI001E4438C6|nr:TadE/TadG family type IV pilus assembly protein [Sphingomonas sp. IC-11]MCD2316091.1 pilus assembly protein [Sphingomonas sp. IC-11]
MLLIPSSLPNRLRRDRRGAALMEFAFSAPLVLALGLYGVEIGNQALVHMRLSQIALNLADNASRMGLVGTNNVETMREGDMNDILQAARIQGDGMNLTQNGRVIVSSLENVQQSYDTAPVQRIHWQRCIGKMRGEGYDSSYGTTSITAGTTSTLANAGTVMTSGMGPTGEKVSAPPNSAVMYVEINYLYEPLVSEWLATPFRMQYRASMIVRNNRDFRQIYNPVSYARRATCNLYTS